MSYDRNALASATRPLPEGREVRVFAVDRRLPGDTYIRRYVDVQLSARAGLGGSRGAVQPMTIRSDALRATIEALEQVEREMWT